MTVLLREAIGERLRRTRTAQQRTLREVSRTAKVSLGYLSEVERGRKEPSSELLAAICDALSLPLADLMHGVAGDLRPHSIEGAPIDVGRLVKAPGGQAKVEVRLAHPLPRQVSEPVAVQAAVVAA
jgi:transcriptional regulator with XRE-family HTH domain